MSLDRLTRNPADPGTITEEAEAALDQLDTELMKRGTLGADSIDWPRITRLARAVLQDCLHLQALRALILAQCQSTAEPDLTDALATVARALSPEVWPLWHPQGARAGRKRQQWGGDLLAALGQGLKQLDLATRGLPPALLAQASGLSPQVEAVGLDAAAWRAALAELRPRDGKDRPARPTGPDGANTTSDGSGGAAPRELDAKGRAELRRDLRALADRVTRHEPGAELGYLMRRYAAWLEFRQMPPVDAEGRVEQQPMPANIVDEARAAAERPGPVALARLEDRLSNSPDWFEGHRLAARIALGLGHAAVAAAIRDQVARRLADLPGLAGLRYANGAPYLDPSLRAWVASAIPATEVPHAAPDEAEPAPEAPKDLQQRIAGLEAEVSGATSRRGLAVAKLALARALGQTGLTAHARLLLHELSDTLADPVLAAWDKDLAEETRAELSRLTAPR